MPASVQILPIRSVAADRRTGTEVAERSFSQIEQFARTYGSSYDSYIATDTAGKEFFWSSTGDGLLCTIPQGRFVSIYGRLLSTIRGPQPTSADEHSPPQWGAPPPPLARRYPLSRCDQPARAARLLRRTSFCVCAMQGGPDLDDPTVLRLRSARHFARHPH